MVGTIQDITERKLTEAALLDSEEKFPVVRRGDHGLGLVHGFRRRAHLPNPAVTASLAMTPEELVGKAACVHAPGRPGGDRAAVRRARRRTARLAEPHGPLAAQGRFVPILESSAVPILGVDGRLEGYRGVDRDGSPSAGGSSGEVAARAEDGDRRPACRRSGARFQQHPDGHLEPRRPPRGAAAQRRAPQQDLDDPRAAERAVGLTSQLCLRSPADHRAARARRQRSFSTWTGCCAG